MKEYQNNGKDQTLSFRSDFYLVCFLNTYYLKSVYDCWLFFFLLLVFLFFTLLPFFLCWFLLLFIFFVVTYLRNSNNSPKLQSHLITNVIHQFDSFCNSLLFIIDLLQWLPLKWTDFGNSTLQNIISQLTNVANICYFGDCFMGYWKSLQLETKLPTKVGTFLTNW